MTHDHPEAAEYSAVAHELLAAAFVPYWNRTNELDARDVAAIVEHYAQGARELGHECLQLRVQYADRAAQLLRDLDKQVTDLKIALGVARAEVANG